MQIVRTWYQFFSTLEMAKLARQTISILWKVNYFGEGGN
jgi:hypothetical protein